MTGPAQTTPPVTVAAGAESETRALLRIVSAQSENANPIVAVAAVVLIFTMYNRVGHTGLLTWAGLTSAMAIWRHLISKQIRERAPAADEQQLQQYSRSMLVGTGVSSVVMGSAFWLIALQGDIFTRMIVTLISMVHMVAVLLYIAPKLSDRLIRAAGNVGQGMLFWLGVGSNEAPHWEVLVVYGGLFWCGLVFGREQLRQFRDSLRVRNENVALLAQLEEDRKVIQGALEEARVANDSKSRFLAAASHDLRQPLHALTMFLGTLGFHVTTADARRLLGRVQDTVRVLEEQFNSLLDMSRFDVGAVSANPQTFRIDSLIEKLCEEFRPQADAKSLAIQSFTVPAQVTSDRLLLSRVLRNLIDNAIHYTNSGHVHVTMHPEAGRVLVTVEDTGAGIAVDQQARIFDEYTQLDNPGRQRNRGVGLGLAIVRRIDQLLDLQLQLQSEPGAGSRFTFAVSAAVELQPETPPRAAATDPLAFRTDLVIWLLDDDPVILESLRHQLEAWGALVVCFLRPEDLLSAIPAAATRPDWVLTDDMLGSSLSGLATAEILSREFNLHNICLITGNTEPVRLAELRASAYPVIVKPATAQQLIALFGSSNA